MLCFMTNDLAALLPLDWLQRAFELAGQGAAGGACNSLPLRGGTHAHGEARQRAAAQVRRRARCERTCAAPAGGRRTDSRVAPAWSQSCGHGLGAATVRVSTSVEHALRVS